MSSERQGRLFEMIAKLDEKERLSRLNVTAESEADTALDPDSEAALVAEIYGRTFSDERRHRSLREAVYESFDRFNRDYFGGELGAPPHVHLGQSPFRNFVKSSALTGAVARIQYLYRATLYTGDAPDLVAGEWPAEGLRQLTDDWTLNLMVRQSVFENHQTDERGYEDHRADLLLRPPDDPVRQPRQSLLLSALRPGRGVRRPRHRRDRPESAHPLVGRPCHPHLGVPAPHAVIRVALRAASREVCGRARRAPRRLMVSRPTLATANQAGFRQSKH